jgi:hypothetical protein
VAKVLCGLVNAADLGWVLVLQWAIFRIRRFTSNAQFGNSQTRTTPRSWLQDAQKKPQGTRLLGLCESNEVASPSAFPSDFLLYAYGNLSSLGYCCRRAMMKLLQSNLAHAAVPIAAFSSFSFSCHGLRTRVFRLRAVPPLPSKNEL